MRNAFAAELCALAARDERVALITSDVGNNLFNAFKAGFPDRFVNCGIAEATMTGMAAGMALCGLRPVTFSIASFNPGRCLEQIRVDVCLHRLPVVMVGMGAGLAYASLGPTHHALEDVAWLRALPGLSILCPADAVETRVALQAALAHDGPVYLRLGKKNEAVIHQDEPAFAIGRNIPLRPGTDVCILAAGPVAAVALAAADALEREGVSCAVTSLATLKPLDEDNLASVLADYPVVMILEEHGPCGGAWSAVAEWLTERVPEGLPEALANRQRPGLARLLHGSTPDAFLCEGGDAEWVRERTGLEAGQIARRLLAALREAGR